MVSGSGKGVVVATGAATYIASLARALPSGRTMTAFDFAVRRVVYLFIAFIVIMVPLVIVLSGTTTGESPRLNPQDLDAAMISHRYSKPVVDSRSCCGFLNHVHVTNTPTWSDISSGPWSCLGNVGVSMKCVSVEGATSWPSPQAG